MAFPGAEYGDLHHNRSPDEGVRGKDPAVVRVRKWLEGNALKIITILGGAAGAYLAHESFTPGALFKKGTDRPEYTASQMERIDEVEQARSPQRTGWIELHRRIKPRSDDIDAQFPLDSRALRGEIQSLLRENFRQLAEGAPEYTLHSLSSGLYAIAGQCGLRTQLAPEGDSARLEFLGLQVFCESLARSLSADRPEAGDAAELVLLASELEIRSHMAHGQHPERFLYNEIARVVDEARSMDGGSPDFIRIGERVSFLAEELDHFGTERLGAIDLETEFVPNRFRGPNPQTVDTSGRYFAVCGNRAYATREGDRSAIDEWTGIAHDMEQASPGLPTVRKPRWLLDYERATLSEYDARASRAND